MNETGMKTGGPDKDVVVVGGNAMGLITALFCRKNCPKNTSIVVYERAKEPPKVTTILLLKVSFVCKREC